MFAFAAVVIVTIILIPFALLGLAVGRKWGPVAGVLVAVLAVVTVSGTMLAFEAKSDRDYARRDIAAREACRSIYWDDATSGPMSDATLTAWEACMTEHGG